MNKKNEKDESKAFSRGEKSVKACQGSVSEKTNQGQEKKKSKVDSYLNQLKGIRSVPESMTVTFPIKKN